MSKKYVKVNQKMKKIFNRIAKVCAYLILIILPMTGITASGDNNGTTYIKSFSQWKVLFGNSDSNLNFNIFVFIIFLILLLTQLLFVFIKKKKTAYNVLSLVYLACAGLFLLNRVFFNVVNKEAVADNSYLTIGIGYGILIAVCICLVGAYTAFISADYENQEKIEK